MNQSILLPHFFPVASHTDHVTQGTLFVAIPGKKENGAQYVLQALQRGATTIVVQDDTVLSDEQRMHIKKYNAELIIVPNARLALAQLSSQAARYPAQKLKIIGITGTKGKTTTAFLLAHLLRTAGKRVALLSSVYNMIDTTIFKTELTTQHPDYLHQFFNVCVQHGIEFVVMEVAAQAFTLNRVDGIEFDGVIFTNFSHEHGEFYSTIDDYFQAKMNIFKQVKPNAPLIINQDHEWYEKLSKSVLKHISFSFRNKNSGAQALLQSSNWDGVHFQLVTENIRYSFVCKSLIGDFNAYNCAAVVLMAHSLNIAVNCIQNGFDTFKGVPGRFELYHLSNGARGIIDKAHNPSSFDAVLSTLRLLTSHLIVVFGAGGDRDASKRPVMGSIAAQYADLVIITSDNSRSEKLHIIIQHIMDGIQERDLAKIKIIDDRQKAIELAFSFSNEGSIIALLGKGADEYELVNGVKTYFSERSILQSL